MIHVKLCQQIHGDANVIERFDDNEKLIDYFEQREREDDYNNTS